MKNFPARTMFMIASLGLPFVALAQTPPPFDAGKALQEAKPPQPKAPRKAPDPVIVQPEEKPLTLPAGETLTVNAFRFEGAEIIPEEELQAAVASFKGRALSMAEIEAVAKRVTALYRNRGYLVAQTYVPRQDASGGTLTLRVLIGHYGKVTVRNQSRVRDGQIQGYFTGLTGDKAVSRDELERAMLVIGDLPGATMPKLTVAAGAAQGTSDFDVEVGTGKRYTAYLMGDNYGSRYTGEKRLSLGGSYNSPFGLGDQLSFSGMATQAHEMLNGRLAYAAPLGSQGVRGEVALARTTYQLGDTYTDLDAVGRADSLEVGFSYPIRRTRVDTLTLALNLASRWMRDELRTVGQLTPKRSYAGTLGLTYERYGKLFGLDTYGSVNGSFSHGLLKITDDAERTQNEAGANTVGTFDKASLTMSGRLSLTEKLTASASLGAQKATNRNLDSSEQLMISGTRGVMAFQQTVSGDNGYMANGELRYALPVVFGATHAVGVCGDTGRVYLQHGEYTTVNGVRLSDVGVNYSLSWKMVGLRGQYLRAVGAWPSSAGREDRTRILLQIGVMF